MMQKLSGWMPTAIRGEHSPWDLVLSLAVRELEEDSFIFALCQDHKMRMWSLRVRMKALCSAPSDSQRNASFFPENMLSEMVLPSLPPSMLTP